MNKTGYLTKATILRNYSKSMDCSRIEEYSRFSLQQKSDQLIRHKNQIKKISMGIISKPFNLSKKADSFINQYRLFFLNNMEFSFILNIFLFFIILFVVSILTLFNKKVRTKVLDLILKNIEKYDADSSSMHDTSIANPPQETIITLEFVNNKLDQLIKINKEECQRLNKKIEIRDELAVEKVKTNTIETILKNEGIELEKLANKSYTCAELRSYLTKYNLECQGIKEELIDRLQNHLKNIHKF